MHYNIIIAGSRNFKNYDMVKKCLKNFLISKQTSDKPTIICGMAKGADLLGFRLAKEYKLPLKEFYPNWDMYGKKAGYIRNKQMAEYAHTHGNGVLFAFWDGKSKGTKLMIELANKYELETHIFYFESDNKE